MCKGWDFPTLLTREPRDACPGGGRRSPAPLAPWIKFIVFAQKETPSSQKGSCSRIRKASSTRVLALFPRPKLRDWGGDRRLRSCPLSSLMTLALQQRNSVQIPGSGVRRTGFWC